MGGQHSSFSSSFTTVILLSLGAGGECEELTGVSCEFIARPKRPLKEVAKLGEGGEAPGMVSRLEEEWEGEEGVGRVSFFFFFF